MVIKTFTTPQYPDLPVVGPDYSYTMDLMDMTSIDWVAETSPGVYKDVRVPVNNNIYNKGYNYVLVFVDTTSRKAWLFPQKTKTARETYKNFVLFKTLVEYPGSSVTMMVPLSSSDRTAITSTTSRLWLAMRTTGPSQELIASSKPSEEL